MYFKANDFELLYLIKDGNEPAKRALYLKYEHLIAKLFKEMYHIRQIMFSDFKQECLMCLEKAIKTYRDEMGSSFYTFFMLIVKRRVYKLYKRSNLLFQEQYNAYDLEAYIPDSNSEKKILRLLLKEINFEDPLEKELFEECILGNVKIAQIAFKNGVKYNICYLKYKKIKDKAEKILTNHLV